MSNHPNSAVRFSSRSSSASFSSDFKGQHTTRVAETTTVISPIDPSQQQPTPSPFAHPTGLTEKQPQHHVSDVGFGYVADTDPAAQKHIYHPPLTPASPLRTALKTPKTAVTLNPFSPTFREEAVLELNEKKTQRENARDLRIKTRVRIAKVFLRCVNFSCSLIVLSMLSTSLTIFQTTKALPQRNGLPPWALGTNPWPQYVMLGMSCLSLAIAVGVFFFYWKNGRRRGEKVSKYYSYLAVGIFTFSTVMWVGGTAILQNSKANGNSKDLWGWSCNNNLRSQLFQSEVNYALVCRLQDWSLVCAIIEVVLETMVICIYAVVFYRFRSKQRLRKAMDVRDKARSDLYLAHLRIQSAPNTPGFPMSPYSMYRSMAVKPDEYYAAENGENYSVQFASPKAPAQVVSRPFQLQPPPIRIQNATPLVAQEGFGGNVAAPMASASSTEEALPDQVNEHVGAAPGEQTYNAVSIPGAYTGL